MPHEQEQWVEIPDFSDYLVSNLGRIFNRRTDRVMSTTRTNHGHVKINLSRDDTRERFTRSVALLVAEAFVEPPTRRCDTVVQLDGDLGNVRASNLAWRPRGFAWKYVHQLKLEQPLYYRNLPVFNTTRNIEYPSIVDAGMYEGLLFSDIWRSTYTGAAIFPNNSVFEIVSSYVRS